MPSVHADGSTLDGDDLADVGATATARHAFASGSISGSCDGFRARVQNIQFNNTIELNSTIHFCRLNHSEFNYSSNPTYLTGSQIRVKQNIQSDPVSYITSIGLYSADNQLLAVGKLSEPIRKDPTIELTFRARLDY
jgi:phage-related tail fiber protein